MSREALAGFTGAPIPPPDYWTFVAIAIAVAFTFSMLTA